MVFDQDFYELIASLGLTDQAWGNRAEDNYYIDNLRGVGELRKTGRVPAMPPILELGKEYDFLARPSSQAHLLKAVNLAAMASIAPTFPCALVATARNEGPFLLEWLAHHRAVGLKKIYLYTNDSTDGSTELLTKLAEHGIINLILNEADRDVSPQIKAYEHSLMFVHELRLYDWVFYLDIDEFFIPEESYDFLLENSIRAVKSLYGAKPP